MNSGYHLRSENFGTSRHEMETGIELTTLRQSLLSDTREAIKSGYTPSVKCACAGTPQADNDPHMSILASDRLETGTNYILNDNMSLPTEKHRSLLNMSDIISGSCGSSSSTVHSSPHVPSSTGSDVIMDYLPNICLVHQTVITNQPGSTIK